MYRKSFIQTLAMGTLGILAPKFTRKMPEKNIFVHHVFFWLKNPDRKEDYNKLLMGLEGLSKVSTIERFHIGKPADTNRDVIDRSYSVSWLVMFRNKEDQDKYQVDPIHIKFVEQYSSLWDKVIVYDADDV
jgi:Stress responsive A/B Barrel Domain